MKTPTIAALALLVVLLLAATALGQTFPPWETYGQTSPDRVMAARISDGYHSGTVFAPYTETGRFAYGTVFEQVSPDRALMERTAAGYADGPAFAPFSLVSRFAFGTVHEQVSPDRAMHERMSMTTE